MSRSAGTDTIDSDGGVGTKDAAQNATQNATQNAIRERARQKLKRPSFYVVVVHNDPITPRAFVVDVLKRYFDKREDEAHRIMLLAHNYGVGVVAKFGRDVAESKARQVNEFARTSGYPLHFSVEEE